MDLPISLQDITYAENYLAQGDLATATPLLERLVELAEEYIDAECKTEEKRQYFSFDSKFERLAYRRVEKDPRELVQVEVPFDRLYSDMAFAYIRQQDYVSARNALMQAVRWDPMNCNYRLDLAELFRVFGDSTRIKILYALFESELCVNDIAQVVGISQSAVSHQLRLLKTSKLVKFRREGKAMYYSLDDDHVRSMIALGMEHTEE